VAPFHYRLRVRYNECDPQGVVFNANYLTYADIAITELYREAFGSWQAPMDEHGIDMVVAAAGVRFLAPARFDDDLELVIDIARIGETSTTTRVKVERAGASLAEIEVRHVVVGLESRAKQPIPAPMREALQPFMMSG